MSEHPGVWPVRPQNPLSPAPGAGFPTAAVSWLACPVDGSPLRLAGAPASRDQTLLEGSLDCARCGRGYPVRDGIPRLLPDAHDLQAEEAEAKQDERRQRDLEATTYDRNLPLRILSLFELPATLGRLRCGKTDRVLEVGCGTGRFTHHLAGRADAVLALDHSVESLRVARGKISPGAGVVFAQADASYLPVRSEWATRVLSCQMLEHLPTSDSRGRAVAEMARSLQPEGRLVLSAYWHQPLLRRWTPKQGRHSGEIYFYRFGRGELSELLGRHLRLRGMTGRLLYILLADAVKS